MAPSGLLTKKGRSPIPLRGVKVLANVRGYAAQVESSFEYENEETHPIEAIFTFPLDSSSTVVGFAATLDDRKIKGKVKEKQEAKDTYDDAIASGQSAFLMESEREDIFTVSVGNLPAQKKAVVTLKFIMELHTEHDGSVKFNLPSVLTPRYSKAGEENPTKDVTYLPASEIPYTFSFNARIEADVDKVESISHKLKVTTTVDDDGFEVTDVALAEEHKFDKDLVLTIAPRNLHRPHVIVEAGSDPEVDPPLLQNPAISLNYFPDFSSAESVSELVFVIDRSGSMSGSYIAAAKETLMLFLKSIPDGCFFNIVGFGSRYEFLFPDSVPYDQTHLDKASQHTQSIFANMGGTELLRPLQKVFSMPSKNGLPKQVFVLTDGAVSNTSAVIREVKKNVHVARCFAVGIGSGASTELVKGIAVSGNGSSEFIQTGERMQPKVMRMLKRALAASISDVCIAWSLPDDAHVIQTPTKIPPVFSGDRLIIYGLVANVPSSVVHNCSATMKGVVSGNPFEHMLSFSLDARRAAPSMVVHQLAIRSVISDLQEDSTDEDSTDEDTEKKLGRLSVKRGAMAPESREKLVVQLSTAASVVCKQTAFIAVDDESEVPVQGSMEVHHIPVAIASDSALLCNSMNFASAPRAMVKKKKAGGFFGGLFGSKAITASRGSAVSHDRSMSMLRSAPPPPGHASGAFGDGGALPPPAGLCAPPPPPQQQQQTRYLLSRRLAAECDSDDDEEENAVAERCLTSDNQSHPQSHPQTQSQGGLLPSMLVIVSQQKASGAWTLTAETAQLINKSMKDLENVSPFPTPMSEIQSSVWVTAVILVWLEMKFDAYRDEWELLGEKARGWLKKQALPQGITLQSLLTDARKLF